MKKEFFANRCGRIFRWLACFSLTLVWGATAAERAAIGAELVDRIVAVVNDDIITLYDLEQAMRPYRQQIDELGYDQERARRMIFKLRQDILGQMINDKLTDQEAKRLGITISEKAVDNAIENVKKNGYFTDEQFRSLLAQEGMTMEEYRKQVRDRLMRMQLVNLEVRSKIVITQEEVRAYYEANYLTGATDTKYHLKHIIKRLPATAGNAERAAGIEQMKAIRARVQSGESFEALADQYSDPEVTAPGGDLGVLPFSSLSRQIKDAVKGLSTGDVTPVLETDQGIQLIYVYQVEKTSARSFEEVSNEIEQKLYEEVVDKYFSEWLEKLLSRSLIKITL